MVIRPLRMKRQTEDLREYIKLSSKASNRKINKSNPLARLNKIFITSVLLCSVWIATYKTFIKQYFFKKSSTEDRKDYIEIENENSKKEADWMTKMIFTNEYKSNK